MKGGENMYALYVLFALGMCGFFGYQAIKMFGETYGAWLIASIVCMFLGPQALVIGFISLIVWTVVLISHHENPNYIAKRSKAQKIEEENYGIIDFTKK